MKRFKPTTQSRRKMTVVSFKGLSKVSPLKSALLASRRTAGRNNLGRITVRHRGGGVKRAYRIVDFKQTDKIGVPAKVETLEYDPNRSAFIMKVLYRDGDRRYLLAPVNIQIGSEIVTALEAALEEGNRMALKNIPVGYSVYNVELQPGKGGQIVKSAGAEAQVLAHESGYTHLKLPSSEVRKVLWDGYASLGKVSNPEHNLVVIGKAGRKRLMGVRPTVRGSAMNPVDHPYGGGEGRQPRGTKRPKSKWGKVTGGKKTRNKKKWSNKLIVKKKVKKRRKK